MRIYDDEIKKWLSLCNYGVKLPLNSDVPWKDVGTHQMILRNDMAYELGGSDPSFFALGGTALTEDNDLISEDEIRLIDPDLSNIYRDTSYARLTITLIDNANKGVGDELYNKVKHIENIRYHVNPEGFMSRVSSIYGRESIRISRNAIEKGISFSYVGNLFLNLLRKNPNVIASKIIFITDSGFDFKSLDTSIKKVTSITAAIDHIFKNVMTDCSTCSLQKLCDEVEELREIHFGRK